jgi:hypothetical protein
MHFRASPVAVAAVLLTSTFCTAIACPSDHVSAPELRAETIGGLSGVMHPETSISAPSELSVDALEAQITSPNWMLLLDHEGESFTLFAGAYVAGFEPIALATSALDIAGSASSISLEVPALGLVLEDDAAAVLSELHEASYPTITGSSSAALSETEIALSGYKDR